MREPADKGPRWAPRYPRCTARPPQFRRRYPALDAFRVARARGLTFHSDHFLARAAFHEANAAQYDAFAERSLSLGEAGAWGRMAVEEMAESIAILAEAERVAGGHGLDGWRRAP
jgi:hypothetical protein